MKTKPMMVACSGFLGILGIVATFAPVEILRFFDSAEQEPLPTFIQLAGGLYFGFAMANWTAKDNIIGGIYSRPMSMGNFLHFVLGFAALAKLLWKHPSAWPTVVLMIGYGVFALFFGYLVFGRGTACVTKT